MTQAASTTAAGGTPTEQPNEVLGMSDEDFLKQTPPEVVETPVEVKPAEVTTQPEVKGDKAEESNTPAEVTSSEAAVNGGNVAPNAQVKQDDPTQTSTATATTSTEAPAGGQGKEAPAASSAAGSTSEAAAVTVNYEAEYKKLMAPFKANGRTIELKSPEEAVALMQMGANFTRKMQEIAPHRKVLLMLQNNGIDEGKLSYLIDLDKKNPQAIQKLVKEAGIDPMDIDTSVEPAYQPGNHLVNDEAANFQAALNDVGGSPNGQETLIAVNSWDQASKDAMWKNPQILTEIHAQRETGVYDLISSEVDRQRMLGKISPETPFIEAYHRVGQEMVAAKAGAGGQPGAATAGAAQPVATTVAAPKPKVTNGEQANAASSTRTSPRKAETVVNVLAMSDDDFLKQFENRV